ncbi:MAG: glyoxalase [Planctomycetota bacterium]|nr:MAG: glyoxalase [Planctomycetota bacterium]
MAAKPIPDGFHTVTPHIVCQNAAAAIDFYKKAFGAEEVCRMPNPGGGLMHAEVAIGNSRVMLVDEMPQMGCKSPKTLGGSPVTIHLYVNDADKVFNQAVSAGATPIMPVQDMFWGDRYGLVADPFGHQWSIATHKEDLTPQQMSERMAKMMAGGGCGG